MHTSELVREEAWVNVSPWVWQSGLLQVDLSEFCRLNTELLSPSLLTCFVDHAQVKIALWRVKGSRQVDNSPGTLWTGSLLNREVQDKVVSGKLDILGSFWRLGAGRSIPTLDPLFGSEFQAQVSSFNVD